METLKPGASELTLKERIMKENQILFKRYEKYIRPLAESKRRKGQSLDLMTMATVLNLLENLREDMKVAEATTSQNVGTFIQYGYDLVTAIYPNLVLNTVASVQPLKYKSGRIWFYNILYQTAKGWVTANDPALSATTGLRADRHYSSEYIDQTPTGTVNSSNQAFSGTIPNAPLRTDVGYDYFWLSDGLETFTPDHSTLTAGNDVTLVGDKGGTGTVDIVTGVYSVAFNTAPVTGSVVAAHGKISFESTPAAIGKTKISLVDTDISAQKHAMITEYSLDAEHDLARNFGMIMSDEVIKGTAALIRAEIDSLGLYDIKLAAKKNGAGSGSWDGTVDAGLAQLDHFRTLLTTLKGQSNAIFAATRMVHGNFIASGNDISTVLEVLPEYRPNPAIGSELAKSGPYVAGTIAGFTHIKVPDYDPAEWVVGNRGISTFHTGYVIAPYKGLMVTPPVSSPDNPFQVTRGLWAELGRKVVNPLYYSYGTATGITL